MTVLSVENVETGYDQLQVLWEVSLKVEEGERVVILGSNGAGKTTLLKTICGLLPCWTGTIELNGERIDGLRTDQRVRKGIAFLSELGIVPNLSVDDNLSLGGYHLPRAETRAQKEAMYERFPDLDGKRKEAAGSLSGGQRKMLGIARALINQPQLLVMDEPSAGLSPVLVDQVLDLLRSIDRDDLSMLVAEQNTKVLDLADRVCVLDSGRISFSGTVEALENQPALREAYFGVRGG